MIYRYISILFLWVAEDAWYNMIVHIENSVDLTDFFMTQHCCGGGTWRRVRWTSLARARCATTHRSQARWPRNRQGGNPIIIEFKGGCSSLLTWVERSCLLRRFGVVRSVKTLQKNANAIENAFLKCSKASSKMYGVSVLAAHRSVAWCDDYR